MIYPIMPKGTLNLNQKTKEELSGAVQKKDMLLKSFSKTSLVNQTKNNQSNSSEIKILEMTTGTF